MNWSFGTHTKIFWPRHGASIVPEDNTHPLWYELASYLGDDFNPFLCHGNDGAVNAEAALYDTAQDFYRDTQRYLYHLTAYYLEHWKQPAYAWVYLLSLTQQSTILDYSCGIGCDGVALMEAGFRHVSFADLEGESLRYLRWRLQQRMYLDAPVYTLPTAVIPLHDLVWCMDTIEHIPPQEQIAFIDYLKTHGNCVILNLVDDRQANGVVHHAVDIEALTAHIADR